MTIIILKFVLYSVLGCALESLWSFIKSGKIKTRRMLLNLPMCPVYGIGGVCMSVFLGGFSDSVILIFSFGALLASAVELMYYLACAGAFYVRVWDYSKKKANFMGGVCGEYTLLWGILAVIFVRFIDPLADAVIFGMSEYERLIASVFLSFVTITDIKMTAKVLMQYKMGERETLPQCFWYMNKI